MFYPTFDILEHEIKNSFACLCLMFTILRIYAILVALLMLGSIARIKSSVIVGRVMMAIMGSLGTKTRVCRWGPGLMSMRNRNDRLIYSAFVSVKYNISNNI